MDHSCFDGQQLSSMPLRSLSISSPDRPHPFLRTSIRRSKTTLAVGPTRRAAPPSRNLRTTGAWLFDGQTRRSVQWDGLRRDLELWDEEGDCLVYLYAEGQSKRGPSFRLRYEDIRARKCDSLLGHFAAPSTPRSPGSEYSFRLPETSLYLVRREQQLHVPAPPGCTREAAFRWHISTRNFFAWICGKPLVGSHLGEALVTLMDRMVLFRSNDVDNVKNIRDYIDQQGYSSLSYYPDHALGLLYFAEHFELQDLYTVSFAHCVGMHEELISSHGFEIISQRTKTLIVRARLEMDIRLERVAKALSSFLEDDIPSLNLGIAHGCRTHLEYFRSFVHSFYVCKYGYWPPPRQEKTSAAFSTAIYRAIALDFQHLYNFLADRDSSPPQGHKALPLGQVDVYQEIENFNRKHHYEPLPHPLPLLPQIKTARVEHPGATLGRLLSRRTRADRRNATFLKLCTATNGFDENVVQCDLVRAYMEFEKDCTLGDEQKISSSDGRRARWILIYAILQTLLSATKVAPELKGIDKVEYPLCCQNDGNTFGNSAVNPRLVRPLVAQTPAEPTNEIIGQIVDVLNTDSDLATRQDFTIVGTTPTFTSPISPPIRQSSLRSRQNRTGIPQESCSRSVGAPGLVPFEEVAAATVSLESSPFSSSSENSSPISKTNSVVSNDSAALAIHANTAEGTHLPDMDHVSIMSDSSSPDGEQGEDEHEFVILTRPLRPASTRMKRVQFDLTVEPSLC